MNINELMKLRLAALLILFALMAISTVIAFAVRTAPEPIKIIVFTGLVSAWIWLFFG